jgi:hypothetical protein
MGRPPPHVHGKEGVSGSSPEEGLKVLQLGNLCCLGRRGPVSCHREGHQHGDLQGFCPKIHADNAAGHAERTCLGADRLTGSVAGVRIIPSGLNIIPSNCGRPFDLDLVAVFPNRRHQRDWDTPSRCFEIAVHRQGPSRRSIKVELNRTRGCSTMSKKCSARRCLSRVSLPVSRLSASIVKSIAVTPPFDVFLSRGHSRASLPTHCHVPRVCCRHGCEHRQIVWPSDPTAAKATRP